MGRGSGARTAETEAAHDSRSDQTFLEDKLPTSHSHKDPLHRQEVSVAIVLIAGDPLEAYIVGGQRQGGEQGRQEVRRALPDLRTLTSLGSPWLSDSGTRRCEASSEGRRGLRRTGGVLCKTACGRFFIKNDKNVEISCTIGGYVENN